MKRITLAVLVLALASLAWVRPSSGLPDLVIRSMSFEPEYITTPTDVWVHVVIENRGDTPASYGVDIGVDARGPGGWQYGVAVYVGRVPAPGETIVGHARIDQVPCPGTYSVMVEVDPFGSVVESNEENNSAAAKFVAR